MPATQCAYASTTAAAVAKPFRSFAAIAAALLIATLITASAAHALVLGEASVQSALGAPLRVVIPIAAAPGELLQTGCFRVLQPAGDDVAQIVTARVSLERAAAAPRLVVTTVTAVNEPAFHFGIQSDCGAVFERTYAVLLDPLLASTPVPAAAASPSFAREPRQDRAASQQGSARHSVVASAASATRVVRVLEPPARTLPVADTVAVMDGVPLPRLAALAAIEPTAFHPVATAPAVSASVTAVATKSPPVSSGVGGLWSLAAAALALGVVIALAAIARRRDKQPEIPQWTRSRSMAGPRSLTDLSTATLPNTFSRAAATTIGAATKSKPAPARSSLRAETRSPPSRRGPATVDPSTIDTLLDALNPDIVEERAVREAFAAARSDVEREMDGNAILQAIDAAERDLHLLGPEPAQSAIERALEDDLLQHPQRH